MGGFYVPVCVEDGAQETFICYMIPKNKNAIPPRYGILLRQFLFHLKTFRLAMPEIQRLYRLVHLTNAGSGMIKVCVLFFML